MFNHLFNKYLLTPPHATYFFVCWGYSRKQDKQEPCSYRAHFPGNNQQCPIPIASGDKGDEVKQIATGLDNQSVFSGQSSKAFKEQFSGAVVIKIKFNIYLSFFFHKLLRSETNLICCYIYTMSGKHQLDACMSDKGLGNKCLVIKKEHRMNF